MVRYLFARVMGWWHYICVSIVLLVWNMVIVLLLWVCCWFVVLLVALGPMLVDCVFGFPLGGLLALGWLWLCYLI